MSNSNKKLVTIPFAEHEEDMYRTSEQLKRMWFALFLLIGLLFFSNATWLWHTKQFERAKSTAPKRINETEMNRW